MNYPTHLGIIPDGCRRWAKQHIFEYWEGHKKGIETLERVGKWCIRETPIKYYTIYGLSIENLNRSKLQLDALYKLYTDHLNKLIEDPIIEEENVHIQIIGKKNLLHSEKLQEAITRAEESTKNNSNKYFRLALAYGGRDEIVDSVKKLIENNQEITIENISANMYSPVPEPDLIIRSIEQRVSNFLLWQGAYVELYTANKLWPDMTKEDFIKAFKDYSERQRRYGK